MNDQTFHIISIILAVAAFLIIAIIGWRTDLLKEGNKDGKPYSFHKFQLWIWTLVICPSFSLYWGYIANHKPSINETALVLLGIAAATAVTAEVIASTQEANRSKNPSLKSMGDVPSTGFWSDILKDDKNELSIGRLQQLIFTFIYVGIYLCAFFPLVTNMKYPEFGENAYILMGISTGGYLIGKGLNK